MSQCERGAGGGDKKQFEQHCVAGRVSFFHSLDAEVDDGKRLPTCSTGSSSPAIKGHVLKEPHPAGAADAPLASEGWASCLGPTMDSFHQIFLFLCCNL